MFETEQWLPARTREHGGGRHLSCRPHGGMPTAAGSETGNATRFGSTDRADRDTVRPVGCGRGAQTPGVPCAWAHSHERGMPPCMDGALRRLEAGMAHDTRHAGAVPERAVGPHGPDGVRWAGKLGGWSGRPSVPERVVRTAVASTVPETGRASGGCTIVWNEPVELSVSALMRTIFRSAPYNAAGDMRRRGAADAAFLDVRRRGSRRSGVDRHGRRGACGLDRGPT